MPPLERGARSALLLVAVLVFIAVVLGVALAVWFSTLPDNYF